MDAPIEIWIKEQTLLNLDLFFTFEQIIKISKCIIIEIIVTSFTMFNKLEDSFRITILSSTYFSY